MKLSVTKRANDRKKRRRANPIKTVLVEPKAAESETPSVFERMANRGPCKLGMGCDETGFCYAEYNDQPIRCGRE